MWYKKMDLLKQVIARLAEHAFKTLKPLSKSDVSPSKLTIDAYMDIVHARIQGCLTFASHQGLLFVFTLENSGNVVVHILDRATEADVAFLNTTRQLADKAHKQLVKHSTYQKWSKASSDWVCVGSLTFEPYFDDRVLFTPHVALSERVQGRGIAASLYGMFLNKGRILLTGEHTAAASVLWDRMQRIGFRVSWYNELAKTLTPEPITRDAVKVMWSPAKFTDAQALTFLRKTV